MYFTSVPPSAKFIPERVQARVPAPAIAESSSASRRYIESLTVDQVIPQTGKFIAADLVHMKLSLYQDGALFAEYPIVTKGKPGTPWETPTGFYAIRTKEEKHFSTIGKVYMPYSMQFYGNYFIHGATYYPDGTPTSATFSGGCIKLSTEDSQNVFEFADIDTGVFVHDSKESADLSPLVIDLSSKPSIEAESYLIADVDTGHVYLEHNAEEKRPIASVTKLMTALVANEVISFDKKVPVPEGGLYNPPHIENETPRAFLVGDLFYPLLMQSSNLVADSLAAFYGKKQFVDWMNATAKALDMAETSYADASGISADNISTPDDLFRLAVYISNKKSFIFNITTAEAKTLIAEDGSRFDIKNVNMPAFTPPFIGGKAGKTTAAKETMVSELSLTVNETPRHVAVIVLGSENQIQDTENLAKWLTLAAKDPTTNFAACAFCANPARYRKIEVW
jgi:hypothetical protein